MPSRRQGTFLVITRDAGLARTLEERFQHHGAVMQTKPYQEALAALKPGCHLAGIVVDLDSCDVPSLDAVKSLRESDPLIPVLALASSLESELINALHARRSEFVLKPFGHHNIDSFAQRALMEGWLSDEKIVAATNSMTAQFMLTPREAELIAFAVGIESLPNAIQRLGISESTLKPLLRSLLRKCSARSTDKLAKVVLRGALVPGMLPSEEDEEFASEAHGEVPMAEAAAEPTSQSRP